MVNFWSTVLLVLMASFCLEEIPVLLVKVSVLFVMEPSQQTVLNVQQASIFIWELLVFLLVQLDSIRIGLMLFSLQESALLAICFALIALEGLRISVVLVQMDIT